MKKVYIVTSGEYSDYQIRSVFSTEKLAKKYIEHAGRIIGDIWDEFRIEEYGLDVITKYPKGKNHYVVTMELKSGEFRYIGKREPEGKREYCVLKDYRGVENIHIYCWAKSEEQAKKIATDIRTKVLAEREGLI